MLVWPMCGLCGIGAWAVRDRDACLPPHPASGGRGWGSRPEAGEQRGMRTIWRMGKERTERSRSDPGVAHGRREQEDVRISPKSQVIDSGREN